MAKDLSYDGEKRRAGEGVQGGPPPVGTHRPLAPSLWVHGSLNSGNGQTSLNGKDSCCVRLASRSSKAKRQPIRLGVILRPFFEAENLAPVMVEKMAYLVEPVTFASFEVSPSGVRTKVCKLHHRALP